MSSILNSGNLFGFLGMLLAFTAGLCLLRSAPISGVLFATGSLMVLATRLFALFVAPNLIKPMLTEFNRFEITLMQTLPHFVFLFGFFLLFLGFVFLKLKEVRPPALSRIRK